jgi:hypothetical protein
MNANWVCDCDPYFRDYQSLYWSCNTLHYLYNTWGNRKLRRYYKIHFLCNCRAVLSLIPLIGLILWIYGIYLNIVGGSFVHKVSMGKSAIAVLLPSIIILILIFIVASVAILGETIGSFSSPVPYHGSGWLPTGHDYACLAVLSSFVSESAISLGITSYIFKTYNL